MFDGRRCTSAAGNGGCVDVAEDGAVSGTESAELAVRDIIHSSRIEATTNARTARRR
jgi:hypothetical protein